MFSNLPNRLTLIRVLMAPVFILVFVLMTPWSLWIAFALAVAIEVTDVLDGHLARSRNQVSEVGKFFDPFADSVARFSEFLAFFAVSSNLKDTRLTGMMALWMIAIIFYRDVAVAYLRIAAARRDYIISARTSGKIKAVVQGLATVPITFLAALAGVGVVSWSLVKQFGFWALVVVTVVTFLSGVDYLAGNRVLLKEPAEGEAE